MDRITQVVTKSAEKLFGSMPFALLEVSPSLSYVLIIISFVLFSGQSLKHQNLESYFESKVPSLKEFTRTKAIANTKAPTSRLLANVMQLLQRCACMLFIHHQRVRESRFWTLKTILACIVGTSFFRTMETGSIQWSQLLILWFLHKCVRTQN